MKSKAGGSVPLLTFAISFALLIANGRNIGSGDTTALERTAGALATQGTLLLPDEGPDPFTRPVAGGRISIYPVLPALVATPFFFVFSLFFELSPAGLQIAGKLTAAFLSAAATALLAGAFLKRTSPLLAVVAALFFALGTSVYSTSQALWQHPIALLFLVIALRALEQVDSADEKGRGRFAMIAALSVSLAAASRPAAIPMCAVLFLLLLHRARAHATALILIAGLPALLVSLYNLTYFGAPWRFGQSASGRFLGAFPESIAGLLVSPARGLLIFTPIAAFALWGLLEQARRSTVARGLAAAVFTHLAFIATWNEWHGGESFGPRLLTDLLPPLFFFLPEALAAWKPVGLLLGALSVAIQLFGGWTYDYRWERLHQRGQAFDAALWSWRDSPLAFAVREGVVLQGSPEVSGRRARLRVRRFTPFGPEGSIIEGTAAGLRISGPSLVRDVHLERGARLSEGWISLTHPGDALAFRVSGSGERELRLTGSLDGTVRIDLESQSVQVPTTGAFDLTIPIHAAAGDTILVRPESGDLRLARVSVK